MAGGIDTSKWKPRRLRGTPANKFIKIVSLSVLAVGSVIGIVYHNLSLNAPIKEKAKVTLFTQTEEERARGYFMHLVPQNTSTEIQRVIDEENKLLSER